MRIKVKNKENIGKLLSLQNLLNNGEIIVFQCFNSFSEFFHLKVPEPFQYFYFGFLFMSNENSKKTSLRVLPLILEKSGKFDFFLNFENFYFYLRFY